MNSIVFVLALDAAQDKAAKQDKGPEVDQAKVDEAVQKGCQFLLGAKGGKGKKKVEGGDVSYPPGPRSPLSLVVLTLAHGGYTEDNPKFKKLLDAMIESPLESTYTVAIQAMALQKVDPKKYQWRMAQCAHFLVHNQTPEGDWRYGHPIACTEFKITKPEELPVVVTDEAGQSPAPKKKSTVLMPTIKITCKPEGKDHDNSNSQYACLGLRACLESGIEVPKEVIENSLKAWQKHQCPDGGFSYQGPSEGYGSMSVGGLSSMCIDLFFLKKDYKNDSDVLKALKWVGDHFSVTENPGKEKKWTLYYLYGLERACIIYGTEKVGGHWWYSEGAQHLLSTQGAQGGWGGVPDTCFAILFLRRATQALIKTSDSRARR